MPGQNGSRLRITNKIPPTAGARNSERPHDHLHHAQVRSEGQTQDPAVGARSLTSGSSWRTRDANPETFTTEDLTAALKPEEGNGQSVHLSVTQREAEAGVTYSTNTRLGAITTGGPLPEAPAPQLLVPWTLRTLKKGNPQPQNRNQAFTGRWLYPNQLLHREVIVEGPTEQVKVGRRLGIWASKLGRKWNGERKLRDGSLGSLGVPLVQCV